jgi:Flp pilus assembly pilin Flp
MDRVNRALLASLARLSREEKGQALTEYALVVAVVVVGIIVAMAALRTGIGGKITDVVSQLASASG